jgi:peroxiredoxin Q/BCP
MKVKGKAPDFSLPDETGKTVRLKDFRGEEVVLFFYPKANTPG